MLLCVACSYNANKVRRCAADFAGHLAIDCRDIAQRHHGHTIGTEHFARIGRTVRREELGATACEVRTCTPYAKEMCQVSSRCENGV